MLSTPGALGVVELGMKLFRDRLEQNSEASFFVTLHFVLYGSCSYSFHVLIFPPLFMNIIGGKAHRG